MRIAEMIVRGDVDGRWQRVAVDAADDDDVAEVLALADHPDADVRARMLLELPLMVRDDPPGADVVATVVRLTADPDRRVRDYACFVLAEDWREVDSPVVREALAARLHDVDRDAACEALVGLAYRGDPRALPVVRAALSRPDDLVWRLELVAAAALGAPALHPLVLRHQDGWDDEQGARTADAARRLTDPAGPGEDVLDGVATLYRRRARGLPDGRAITAWHVMADLLGIAPTVPGSSSTPSSPASRTTNAPSSRSSPPPLSRSMRAGSTPRRATGDPPRRSGRRRAVPRLLRIVTSPP